MEEVYLFKKQISDFCLIEKENTPLSYDRQKELLEKLFSLPSDNEFKSLSFQDGKMKVQNLKVLKSNLIKFENIITLAIASFALKSEDFFLAILTGSMFLIWFNKWTISKELSYEDAKVIYEIYHIGKKEISVTEFIKSFQSSSSSTGNDINSDPKYLTSKLLFYQNLGIVKIKEENIHLTEKFK